VKGNIRSFVEGATGEGRLLDGVRTATPNKTPEQIRKASLFVAAAGKDLADRTMLLDMLGLLPAASESRAA